MCRFALILLLTLLTFPIAQGRVLPLWEYGLGVGATRFYHYPAADQTRDWVLPFPTFQYRGKVLKADDREGARAALLEDPLWSLELSGGGLPGLKSNDNRVREGMPDLPWRLQLGPQLVLRLHPKFQAKAGFYQTLISPDFRLLKTQGTATQLQFHWHPLDGKHWGSWQTQAQWILSLFAASRDFHEVYFEVPPEFATAERPSFAARDGFLSYTFTYFQKFERNRTAFYAGLSQEFFDKSVNRESPLHRQDRNFSFLVAWTYRLGESEQKVFFIE